MPNRILREGILTSERIAKLSWPAEVFYRRLMSVVDDFGRYYATPILLRSAAYPLQLDTVGNQDVGKWLTECVRAGLVRTYAVNGKDYLEVLDFRQQVRAKESKFPHPPSTCVASAQQMSGAGVAPAHLVVVVDEGEIARKSRKRPKTSIPENFGLSESVIDWAKSKGYGHLQQHLDNFRLKAAAHDYRYADWDKAFMGAIEADWAKVNDKPRVADKFAGAL